MVGTRLRDGGILLPPASNARTYSIRPLPVPLAESNPVVPKVRRLIDEGDAGAAVTVAFGAAFSDTVRMFGLTVPPSCTSLEFLSRFLRADMGKLCEFLPELYRLYEPVRFGGIPPSDPQRVRGLVERIYTETALAWAYDPLSQPNGPNPLVRDIVPSVGTPGGSQKRS